MRVILALLIAVVVIVLGYFAWPPMRQGSRPIDGQPLEADLEAARSSQGFSEVGVDPAPPRENAAPASDSDDSRGGTPVDTELFVVRVVDHLGHPIPGALVSVYGPSGEKLANYTSSGREGLVSVDCDVPREGLQLDARLPDHSSSGLVDGAHLPKRGECHELLVYPAGIVSGIVLEGDDAPVSGATVQIRAAGQVVRGGTPRGTTEVTTDGQGTFEAVLTAAPVRYSLVARSGESVSEAYYLQLDGARGAHVEMRLRSRIDLRARVIAPDGSEVSGAEVQLWETRDVAVGAHHGQTQPPNLYGTSDADGIAEFVIERPASYYLMASSADLCASEPILVDCLREGAVVEVSLQLVEPSYISGSIMWSTGEPAADVFIAAHKDDADPTPGELLSGERLTAYYGFPQAMSTAAGSFTLGPVRPGAATYKLLCLPDPKRKHCVVVERGIPSQASDVRIVLSEARIRGGFVRGDVRLEDTGAPLEAFTWTLYRQDYDGSWISEALVESRASDGRLYREGLEPGILYAARVLPTRGYLPCCVDSWVASVDGTEVTVSMPVPRELQVRVGDSWQPQWSVLVERIPPHPGADVVKLRRPEGGTLTAMLPSGTYRIRASDGDGGAPPVGVEQQIEIGDAEVPYTVDL